MHFRERGTQGRALRNSTSYPEKPVVQPRGFGTRWLSPLEPYPFGGLGKHHFQIRLRHCYRRSISAAKLSYPEAPAHPPMQRSTSGCREERQGYCWYAVRHVEGPARSIGSSTGCGVQEERWSLEGFATTVIFRPPVQPPELDLACLQPGQELD